MKRIPKFLCAVSILCTLQMQTIALAEGNLEILSIPQSAKPGQKVTVEIKTSPKTHCKVEAQDESITQAFSLLPTETDATGKASWTFEINKDYKADKLPLIFTALPNGAVEEKLVTAIKLPERGTPAADLKFEKMPESASPGEKVTVCVRTAPGARCKIEAQGTGIAESMALTEKTADNDGTASWTWQISDTYKADRLPLIVTSNYKNSQRKLVSCISINHM